MIAAWFWSLPEDARRGIVEAVIGATCTCWFLGGLLWGLGVRS